MTAIRLQRGTVCCNPEVLSSSSFLIRSPTGPGYPTRSSPLFSKSKHILPSVLLIFFRRANISYPHPLFFSFRRANISCPQLSSPPPPRRANRLQAPIPFSSTYNLPPFCVAFGIVGIGMAVCRRYIPILKLKFDRIRGVRFGKCGQGLSILETTLWDDRPEMTRIGAGLHGPIWEANESCRNIYIHREE